MPAASARGSIAWVGSCSSGSSGSCPPAATSSMWPSSLIDPTEPAMLAASSPPPPSVCTPSWPAHVRKVGCSGDPSAASAATAPRPAARSRR
eukprot:2453137-Prymnesium_polylepis.1